MGQTTIDSTNATPTTPSLVLWLQGITLSWTLVECVVSLYTAHLARSAALLAFGADSLVELLSASVALFSFMPAIGLTKGRSSRLAGVLLFLLAGIVLTVAILSLRNGVTPETSYIGMTVTIAALVMMPVLAWLKRKTARSTGNNALAADAVQSFTCAYLAGVTLLGLAINAAFHIQGWIP
jgi:divalent metal cation (Fe/Co/Zn/Cd) transporter